MVPRCPRFRLQFVMALFGLGLAFAGCDESSPTEPARRATRTPTSTPTPTGTPAPTLTPTLPPGVTPTPTPTLTPTGTPLAVSAKLEGFTYYLPADGSPGPKNQGVTVTVTQTGRPPQSGVSQYSPSDLYNGHYVVNGLAAGPAEIVVTKSGCDTVTDELDLKAGTNSHDFQICK